MASHGWFRVAKGFQKVARAATAITVEQGQEIVTKGLQHGTELGIRARTTAMAASSSQADFYMQQQRSQAPPSYSSNVTEPAINGSHSDANQHAAAESLLESKQEEESKAPPIEPLSRPDNSIRAPAENDPESTLDLKEDPLIVEALEEHNVNEAEESPVRLKEGRKVPSSRVGRAFGFASLGLGLAVGTAAEATSRLFGGAGKGSSVVASDANADRLAATLCRMRGAALKMGQMLSIQDESLLPPALTKALNQVRQGADAMPRAQLEKQLQAQLGPDWREKYFESFDDMPFAAASIGQVHRAKLRDSGRDVVVKVQYPGVANSIESDLRNLTMLVKMTGFAPKGLFIDNVIRVGRDELKVECDYLQETKHQQRFKKLVENDPFLSKERFVVPDVVTDVTTGEILTTEYARGGTIDKVVDLDQAERDRIGHYIFYLTIQELFVWRFMQTDPNWGNFLYDVGSRTTTLIDFGAAREYEKSFVDGYLRIVWANANRDEETLMDLSHKMGFLTGEENDIMIEAHKQSGFTVGEPFASDEPFDFRGSQISSRLSAESSTFMQHRLT